MNLCNYKECQDIDCEYESLSSERLQNLIITLQEILKEKTNNILRES